MADMMTFPNTVEEFMEQYKIVDTDKIYTNGAELVPIFRMMQWFEHVSATDTISRQAAIDALEAQERQRATQKRRYTFGNDEFSLEAAYHDCKLVFDGITDDDSFQEADTGLILYYANEIIYALHEALGKDINVLSNDCISRADVEQTVEDNILCYTHSGRPIDQDPDTECHMAIRTALRMLRKDLGKLPSAQPEQRWIPCSERLPEDGKEALVTDGENMMVAYYRNDAEAWDNYDFGWVEGRNEEMPYGINKVIAWMPLPKPFRGEKENETY